MNAYATIRKALEAALTALAELERAAESRALYAAPPIPALQPQVAVTDEMCSRVWLSKFQHYQHAGDLQREMAMSWLTAWQSELGPALGMVNASAERERICAAIKATDDAASECGYMLDSNDCIAVVRGELGPSNYATGGAK